MSFAFRPATRKKSRLRLALDGPSGAGKTFTALRFAFAIAGPGGRVAVINTESGAVEKYMGLSPDGIPWQFFVGELDSFAPSAYTDAIQAAGKMGFSVLIIDSLSHAWQGDGGALDQVSRKGGNSFTAWKDVTPQHNRMVEAILRSPCHVIATMRSKMEYVLEEQVNKAGMKTQVPRKVGMAPIQRAGMEYEFDVVADLDHTHTLTVSKSRCPDIDGAIVLKPGAAFIEPVIAWLSEGSDVDPSFYAVNENELKSTAVAPPAPPPPPADPKEAMRRRMAEQQQQQQTSGSADLAAAGDAETVETETTTEAPPAAAPAADPPGDDPYGYLTAEQADEIERLFRELKTPVEKQIEILRRRGVEPSHGRPQPRLLGPNDIDLIDKLTGMLDAQRRAEFGVDTLSPEAQARAETGVAPEPAEMTTPALEGPPEKKRRGRKPSGQQSPATASNT